MPYPRNKGLRHGVVAFLTLLTFVAAPLAAQADSGGAVPGITIDKTVYAGHDNGTACPGGDTLTGPEGTAATYCLEVTNTGGTHLANVTVDDPALGITQANMTLKSGNPALLAPGASVVWYYETVITNDLVNVASATGLPSDGQGNPDPSAPIPTDEDSATVEVESSGPDNTAIRIDKTVYEGHDAGTSCPGGELVTAVTGTPVTYCFVVTNTGDTWLDNVTVDDLDLDIDQSEMTLGSGNPQHVAPNATVVWYYETSLTEDLVNTATTTGTPTDEGGTPIDITPPIDVDESEVNEESQPITTDIVIDKTVYEGHDSGASCPGADLVFDERGAPITYCFIVTNTGEAHLADVVVDDPDLGITDAAMTLISGNPSMLAPDATAVWYLRDDLGRRSGQHGLDHRHAH